MILATFKVITIDSEEIQLWEPLELLYFLIALIFMVTYLIRIIRLITKTQKIAENSYSSMEAKTLYWLRISCALILLTFLFPVVYVFSPEAEESLYLIEGLIHAFSTFWLAINGYKQSVVLSGQQFESLPVQHREATVSIAPVASVNDESKKENKQQFDDLVTLINEEALYQKKDLTIAELAEKVGLHQKHLSFLINQYSGKNFFNFINEYRVKKAQELLTDNNFSHLSFLGIAFESGFNSKATFNASFKKITGKTPSQYKQLHQLV